MIYWLVAVIVYVFVYFLVCDVRCFHFTDGPQFIQIQLQAGDTAAFLPTAEGV